MGLIWDLMQDSAIADNSDRVAQLEARVNLLEQELSKTCQLLRVALAGRADASDFFRRGPCLGWFRVQLIETNENNPGGLSRQEVIRDSRPGQSLLLLHALNSSTGRPRVAFSNRESREILGCLPPDAAGKLYDDLKLGFQFDAVVAEVTGGGWFSRQPYEITVKISKYAVSLNPETVGRLARESI